MFGTAPAPARVLAALAAAALATSAAAGGVPARPRRVLAIHAFEPGVPVDALFTAGFRAALPLGPALELYSEHIDRQHFPDPAYAEGFRRWLREKYAQAPPDVVAALGVDALEFLADPATTPFPDVPVVFGMVADGAVDLSRLPPSFTGVTEYYAVRETLDLALALFPDTRHVALVGGASPLDRPLNDLLRREVLAAGRPVDVIGLFGLPMEDLLARLRALPPGTVVLAVALVRDGAGRAWIGPQSVPLISAASSGPSFGVFAHVIGLGFTGGVVTDLGEDGKVLASTVLRVLAGERPQDVPIRRSGTNHTLLDGRQLDRWRVPDARVPAGAEVLFRDPSQWRRHRAEILLAAIGFVLQSALIGVLLLERRKRWRAEAKARENLIMIARMNRISALGELVASLAHEINSPLGAVLNNAEAGQRFLTGPKRDEDEVRSCLEDIVRDATRAGDVLRRIRGVLRNETWAPRPLRIDEVVREALHLVQAELRDRGVEAQVDVAPGLPAVLADEVQLVQVFLNLVINALDAVAGQPPGHPRIRIAAPDARGAVAHRVEDSGPGVPDAIAARIFEPFFTTKPNGLGMGLAITRSIVEAHGGSIALSRAEGGGAAFELRLPTAHAPAKGAPAEATG